MLEIIALVFLCSQIGQMAERKGLKPWPWRIYTILSWIAGEVVGIIAGLLIFDQTNLVSLMLMGITGAVTGYFIIRGILQKKPDTRDDDINRIGTDDLRP